MSQFVRRVVPVFLPILLPFFWLQLRECLDSISDVPDGPIVDAVERILIGVRIETVER